MQALSVLRYGYLVSPRRCFMLPWYVCFRTNSSKAMMTTSAQRTSARRPPLAGSPQTDVTTRRPRRRGRLSIVLIVPTRHWHNPLMRVSALSIASATRFCVALLSTLSIEQSSLFDCVVFFECLVLVKRSLCSVCIWTSSYKTCVI